MTVHFICRGNVFRSLIAETYLRSLQIPGLTVLSSGTVADEHRVSNLEQGFAENTQKVLIKHGLAAFIKPEGSEQLTQDRLASDQLVICANAIAYDEAAAIVGLPKSTVVWDIVDIGEGDRIATTTAEREGFEEEVFTEITAKVDELVKQL